jgi:signal peptidase I
MVPTLEIGDRILVNKLTGPIRRNDVIVFHEPSKDSFEPYGVLVKRVVGLPGETISSVGSYLYTDGRRQPASSTPLKGMCREKALYIRTTTLLKNQYYVLGDCLGVSADSREFGPILGSSIIGKVDAIIWRHELPAFHWL